MHSIITRRARRGLGGEGAEKLIRRAAKAALRAQGVDDDCVINVLLTDNDGIHEINLAQRGVDAPTDVLSFPMNELTEGEFDPAECERDFDTGKLMLGDMVISLERCAAQGEEYGHGFEREVSYLTVHSVLHLLGYDHLDEGERKSRMRSREKAIMDTLGL
ncbi:MAG: rRNA maturation RNase YbeY [Oscillospiraceae bacterium]|nr:rRNA maturation RNase YbeY [Oscillospiraceae bacterium]MCD8192922.1 rRNA maturation RNase YbeY [Oscillospiraceae bacterium]